MSKADDTCYVCGQAATTDEHVPPRSWFPESRRDGLLTVRSCTSHNNENSLDVEYVGFVLTLTSGSTEARDVFENQVARAIAKGKGPRGRVLSEMSIMELDGELQLVVEPEPDRLRTAFYAIGSALHFIEYKRPSSDRFYLYSPSIRIGIPEEMQVFIDLMFTQVRWEDRETAHTEVFRWSVGRYAERLIYRVELYGDLDFYLLTKAPE